MSEHQAETAWMRMALSLAEHAAARGEVPVGAIIVVDNRLISSGFNFREQSCQATAHAELLAIQQASQILGRWRLQDCELYVTLEPCLMCAGVIHQARLKSVRFGAFDPKGGALGSLYQLNEDKRLNHRYPVQAGLLQDECSRQLSAFFAGRRRQKLLENSASDSPSDPDPQ